MVTKYMQSSQKHLEMQSSQKHLESAPDQFEEGSSRKIQNHFAVYDVSTGQIFDGVTNFSESINGYNWPDAKIIGQGDDKNLILLEGTSGRIPKEFVLKEARSKGINGKDLARLEDVYDQRYPQAGKFKKGDSGQAQGIY